MKIGIAVYYSNPLQYPSWWVGRCRDSLLDQTFGNTCNSDTLVFYELNYGESAKQRLVWTRPLPGDVPVVLSYRHKPLKNYAAAMNEIYSWMLEDPSIEVFANVNIDDYYSVNRLWQLSWWLWHGVDGTGGYDIASSNYIIIDEYGIEKRRTDFASLDVEKELLAGNNIVSNPCHIMKRKVFETLKFNPNLVPREDLAYWQACVKAGFKIKIDPGYLHYRREHEGQEGNRYGG